MVKSIANISQLRFRLFGLSAEQVDDGQIEIDDVAIMTIGLGKFFEAFATRLQLTVVEKISRLRNAFGVSRTAEGKQNK